MNILLINHYAGSDRHGMEYRPFYLAMEWVRLGHKVSIVAASFSHIRTKSPNINGNITEEIIEGIRYIWLKTPKYQGNGIGRAINTIIFSSMIYKHRSNISHEFKPDVVIASSPHPFIIFGARTIAKFFNARLVFEVRDLWPLALVEILGMSRLHPFFIFMQWTENFAYRVSDRIVSLLPKSNSYMEEHGMAADKFIYIPNGINVVEWEKKGASISQDHNEVLSKLKEAGNFIVCYAGTHAVANDLYTFIESAKLLQLKPITIVLVGQGSEKKGLEQKVSQEGLNNVVFLQPVPKSAIPELFALVDVLYIGLKNQPLFSFGISPNKLMDYMMAAKPVILAANVPNDMVKESGCGISVNPDDPKAISEAIIKLMGMTHNERQAMGFRGKEYVTAHHDYKVLARQYLEILS